MKLNVYLNCYGKRRLVGLLTEGQGRIFFEYSSDFLKSGIPLSPFHLPLKAGIFEDGKRTFDGLFGVFNDSLPDGWGCLLLERKLRRRGISYQAISPLERLSLIGKNPMGALEYEPAEGEEALCGRIELDSLSAEIGKVESGEESALLGELFSLSGSSGGTRPKIVAWVSADKTQIIHGTGAAKPGFTPWIIKFREQHDPKNIGELEYRYSLAAREAGILMPETCLFHAQRTEDCFGIQRFDRSEAGKVHVHTACGLLHASHRYPSLDYENLLKLTWILTQERDDVLQMARRMVFNVRSGNRDDHSKNFSFLLTPKMRWRLAPAYDLTPSAGFQGEQTAMVNGKGRNITDEDLMAAASIVSISKADMKEMMAAVDKALLTFGIQA